MTSIAQLIKASEYACTDRYTVQASAMFLNELIISLNLFLSISLNLFLSISLSLSFSFCPPVHDGLKDGGKGGNSDAGADQDCVLGPVDVAGGRTKRPVDVDLNK